MTGESRKKSYAEPKESLSLLTISRLIQRLKRPVLKSDRPAPLKPLCWNLFWEETKGGAVLKEEIGEMRRVFRARLETDPLGDVSVPAIALYGSQTQRALDNFRVSNLRIHPALITAYAEIKQAAAEANWATGALKPELANAIIRAAEELGAGQWRDQFQLDVFQAGAGTSYNMNLNEVIANRALELLGYSRGAYEHLHPNDHVNHSQSTNDTMPTAMRITALRLTDRLTAALAQLAAAFANKAFCAFLLADSDDPQTFVFDRQGQLVDHVVGLDQSSGAIIDRAVERVCKLKLLNDIDHRVRTLRKAKIHNHPWSSVTRPEIIEQLIAAGANGVRSNMSAWNACRKNCRHRTCSSRSQKSRMPNRRSWWIFQAPRSGLANSRRSAGEDSCPVRFSRSLRARLLATHNRFRPLPDLPRVVMPGTRNAARRRCALVDCGRHDRHRCDLQSSRRRLYWEGAGNQPAGRFAADQTR